MLKKENKENKDRIIGDKTIRDIRTLLEENDDEYYKPKRENNFWNKTLLNMKAMAIEIKTNHQENVFTKLNLT